MLLAQLGAVSTIGAVVAESRRVRHDCNAKRLPELCGCFDVVRVLALEVLSVQFNHGWRDSNSESPKKLRVPSASSEEGGFEVH